jgi:hypothetical protein
VFLFETNALESSFENKTRNETALETKRTDRQYEDGNGWFERWKLIANTKMEMDVLQTPAARQYDPTINSYDRFKLSQPVVCCLFAFK